MKLFCVYVLAAVLIGQALGKGRALSRDNDDDINDVERNSDSRGGRYARDKGPTGGSASDLTSAQIAKSCENIACFLEGVNNQTSLPRLDFILQEEPVLLNVLTELQTLIGQIFGGADVSNATITTRTAHKPVSDFQVRSLAWLASR